MANAVAVCNSNFAFPATETMDGLQTTIKNENLGERNSLQEISRTTRQLRNRTIVTTASPVSTRIKSASKSRLRTHTYTKKSSPTKSKTTTSLIETARKQSTPVQRLPKPKQTMSIKQKSSCVSSAIPGQRSASKNIPVALVHQDAPEGATNPKTKDRLGDKPRLFNESTSRAFRLSNPNSPVLSTQGTPKRLSVLHISFDKENTPPSVESLENCEVKAPSPRVKTPNPETVSKSQEKTRKPARKSLLPKRSSGLKRIVANPSPTSSSPRSSKTNRLISTKLKKLNIEEKTSSKKVKDAPSEQNQDWVSTDSDGSTGSITPCLQAKTSTTVSTTIPTITVSSPAPHTTLSSAVPSSTISPRVSHHKDISSTTVHPPSSVSKTSPVKFYDNVRALSTTMKGSTRSPIAAALTFTNMEETAPKPSPNTVVISHPRTGFVRSKYSLASSDCSPLLAAVLTRPLMQVSLYSDTNTSQTSQTCQCRCSHSSQRPSTQSKVTQSLGEQSWSFLSEYEVSERRSRVWPDEGPDREVERAMSSPQPALLSSSERIKNPIAASFTDEPAMAYNFRPIRVPTKMVVEKTGSAFSRIIVC